MSSYTTGRKSGPLCAVLAVLLLLSLFCIPNASAISDTELYENALLFWVNTERARHGLSELKTADVLNRAAEVRAEEISRSFSHTRPNGTAHYTVLQNYGITNTYIGENIAGGQDSPTEVVKEWMESSGHRKNILNDTYNYMGNGYYYSAGSYYKDHWVQFFSGQMEYSGAKTGFYVAPTDISLSTGAMALNVGASAGIRADIEPAYATAAVIGRSSDSSVLEVTGTEVNVVSVRGVSDGIATLSISCGSVTKTVTVKVGTGIPANTSGGIPLSTSYGFWDVPADHVFSDTISWAAKNEIVSGYPDGSFRPDAACTRAHVITFLWRAAGCPEPASTENPFVDVRSTSPFYKAILWGYYAGITTGTSSVRFSPDDICTRAQVVTFLWRCKGCPTSGGDVYFVDTFGLSPAFTSAISWAAKSGVTSGYADGTFRPYATCTRGHVVTFLYRCS